MNILAEKLCRLYEPIEPMDFYREIFPEGERDTVDSMTKGKYTGIALEIISDSEGNAKVKRYTVTDELDTIDELQRSPGFCIISPISYAGKSRKSENARIMYALVVELDYLIEEDGLERLVAQWSDRVDWIPRPTYTIASGTGLHLYYLFDKPIPLFPNVVRSLKDYKRELTVKIWNRHVTTACTKDTIQQESIFQPFRMVGTLTKLGDKTEAFRTGEPVTVEYMNHFVKPGHQVVISYERKEGGLTLEEAKKKYPEWYENRVVNKQPKKRWVCKRDLYDWWRDTIKDQAVVGHRYYCLMILAIYAVKCDIPRKELEDDCFYLMKVFEKKTDKETNHFTKKDVLSALQSYDDEGIYTYPVSSIENRSGIPIKRNKRNGRKQKDHLVVMNTMKTLKKQLGEDMDEGRPNKKEVVRRWQRRHPNGTKAECERKTGLSRHTVLKWWKDQNSL